MASVDGARDEFVLPLGQFAAFQSMFGHGLLVIEDIATKAGHAGWDYAGTDAHFDESSVYVMVRPDVDGPVDVYVFEADWDPGSRPVQTTLHFAGVMETESGVIRVADSDGTATVLLRRRPGPVPISVWVDVPGAAAWVGVMVGDELTIRRSAEARTNQL